MSLITLEEYSDGDPLISVILPTCNRIDMLGRALKSLVNQTFKNFEVIIINDCGVNPLSQIENFSNLLDIKLIYNEEKLGPSKSRNKAIIASKGKYIAYLDDDDYYLKDHLEILYHHLTTTDYKIAYSDAREDFFKASGDKYTFIKSRLTYSIDFNRSLFYRMNITPINCIVHEKKCLEKTGLFSTYLKCHEDWDLWLRLSRFYDFLHIPKVTCVFTTRIDNSSLSSGDKETMDVTRELVSFLGQSYDSFPHNSLLKEYSKNTESLGSEPIVCKCSIIIGISSITKDTLKNILLLNSYLKDFQLILVGSGVDKPDFLKLYAALSKVLENKPVALYNKNDIGRVLSANLGGFSAKGEYLIFIEDEVTIGSNCIENMEKVFLNNEKVGVVGPVIYSKKIKPLAGGYFKNVSIEFYDFVLSGKERTDFMSIDLIPSFCFMVKKELFDSLNGFDESFSSFFADADFCLKAMHSGYRNFIATKSDATWNNSDSNLFLCSSSISSFRVLADKWCRDIADYEPFYTYQIWSLRNNIWSSDGEKIEAGI